MASIRLLRGRIKSAKNIAQITKAMELVSASKMKKAQTAALMGKAYAEKIHQMVMELSAKAGNSTHPLLSRPAVASGKKLTVLITTNKGLCGGLNTNMFRYIHKEYANLEKFDIITFGSKGAEFMTRIGGTVIADFSKEVPFVRHIPALIELITREYIAGKYDGIEILFSEFISALRQTPVKRVILPLAIDEEEQEAHQKQSLDFVIEPNIEEVFDALLPHYLENQVRDAMLQAEASEHSARMIAMRNATDNAKALIEGLTLMYNKARQEKITYEISDMVTARLAVE